MGGLVISDFQVTLANSMGTKKSFGIQAVVIMAALFLILALNVWGKRMRVGSGKLDFKTT